MQHLRTMKTQQRGLSMMGFLFVSIMLVLVATFAMKLVPAYVEFFAVKKVLSTMGSDDELKSKSNAEIRESFVKRASIDNIKAVEASDLVIDRRNGGLVISTEYAVREKLFANISVVIDFTASSDPNASFDPNAAAEG